MIKKTSITSLLFSLSFFAQAELVVVASSSNPIHQIEKQDLIDVYMGRFNTLPSGQNVSTIDFPSNSKERDKFYLYLTGKSSAQINAYWARLLFTGRARPPLELESKDAVVEHLIRHPNTIAYMKAEDVDSRLKVLYKLDYSE